MTIDNTVVLQGFFLWSALCQPGTNCLYPRVISVDFWTKFVPEMENRRKSTKKVCHWHTIDTKKERLVSFLCRCIYFQQVRVFLLFLQKGEPLSLREGFFYSKSSRQERTCEVQMCEISRKVCGERASSRDSK